MDHTIILEQSTAQQSILFCQEDLQRSSESLSPFERVQRDALKSMISNPPKDRQKRLLISCNLVEGLTSMKLAKWSSQTQSLTAYLLMLRLEEMITPIELTVVLARILIYWNAVQGVKGCAGCFFRWRRMKMGQSVSSRILLRKLLPNSSFKPQRAAATYGDIAGTSSIISDGSFSAYACSTIILVISAFSSGLIPLSFSIYRMEAIFFALQISLTSGIMLMEHIKEASLLLSMMVSSPWKNYSGGISCTSIGSEDQISMTITWFFLRRLPSLGASYSFFRVRSAICLTFRGGGDSPSSAGLVFFSDGSFFLRLRSSPSTVLYRLRQGTLIAGSIPFSNRTLGLRSVRDSARLSSRPFSRSSQDSCSRQISSSCLDIFLVSPKAKVMRDSRLKSDLRSRLVLRPPLQFGQDLRELERMYFSMQSLQKRCEHLRQTGLEKTSRQMVQVRLSKSLAQTEREGMRRWASRLGKRERTLSAQSSRMYYSYSSIQLLYSSIQLMAKRVCKQCLIDMGSGFALTGLSEMTVPFDQIPPSSIKNEKVQDSSPLCKESIIFISTHQINPSSSVPFPTFPHLQDNSLNKQGCIFLLFKKINAAFQFKTTNANSCPHCSQDTYTVSVQSSSCRIDHSNPEFKLSQYLDFTLTPSIPPLPTSLTQIQMLPLI